MPPFLLRFKPQQLTPSLMTNLICALDTTDLNKAATLASAIKPHINIIKLGMEFFYANGIAGYQEIAKAGAPIFLDLKFHDIPNTVAGAIKALRPLKPKMLTLHTAGGPAMLEAAVKEAQDSGIILLGVTLLTSLDQRAIEQIGFTKKLESHVLRLAEVAHSAGLNGVVCSSHELTAIKTRFKNDLITVVPGIRPSGAAKGDQSRTMTPAEATKAGADYIVVGRPITEASNPAEAAKEIAGELK